MLGRVQVDVEGAFESIEVPLVAHGSRVLTLDVILPLGLTFEELDEGSLVVVDVADGSHAGRAGVRTGDILRGTTAVRMQMEYPTANLVFGGVGRPKLKKLLFPTSSPSGMRPLVLCMGAIRSNEQLDNRACLVLERPSPPPVAAAREERDAEGPFDPRLFE
ncbi:hypothetical protein WJX81_006412 [Elliptochloris bilobata]|uniref:PDZ domain-containing protein n=1 Tax=Elliptochloris bilobata TaxID=381761 RepID=A0AAW1QCG5_9CHLO